MQKKGGGEVLGCCIVAGQGQAKGPLWDHLQIEIPDGVHEVRCFLVLEEW